MVVDAVVEWRDYIDGCQSDELMVENKRYLNINGKIPRNANDQGDCIWKDANIYSDSLDSWSGHGGKDDFNRDVKDGKKVLIGEAYWYFGKGDKHKIILSDELKEIIPGRRHRSNSNNGAHDHFVEFFNKKLLDCNITTFGIFGTPALEPEKSDNQTCSRCRAEAREFDDSEEEF